MNTERWHIDMHSHTCWSTDCTMSFQAIEKLCARRGITKLMVTDHNTADGAAAFQQVAPKLVIVGEEIMTTRGEILAYFVKESVPAKLTPEETIKRLRDQGAVISVSHPFDRYRKGAWELSDLREIIGLVDAIEVFNARCLHLEDNVKAVQFAQEHGVPGTIGSDAHTMVEYGRAYAVMRPFGNDPEDFLDALREAETVERLSAWWVHLGSSVAKWSKKLHLRQRMWSGG